MSRTAHSVPSPTSRPGLHVLLWVLQALLALFFAAAGYSHGLMPIADAAAAAPWMAEVPPALPRFVGLAEIAGALGLILPAATRRAPWLTPLAALGLAVIMVLASLFHLARSEPVMVPMLLTAGVVAVFVAWGRLRLVPIGPRS